MIESGLLSSYKSTDRSEEQPIRRIKLLVWLPWMVLVNSARSGRVVTGNITVINHPQSQHSVAAINISSGGRIAVLMLVVRRRGLCFLLWHVWYGIRFGGSD